MVVCFFCHRHRLRFHQRIQQKIKSVTFRNSFSIHVTVRNFILFSYHSHKNLQSFFFLNTAMQRFFFHSNNGLPSVCRWGPELFIPINFGTVTLINLSWVTPYTSQIPVNIRSLHAPTLYHNIKAPTCFI